MKGSSKCDLKFFLLAGCIAVISAALLSIFMGSTHISPGEVVRAFTDFDPSSHIHLAVRTLRLPRTLGCIFVGAAFAAAGAIMQGITRNPLADSGLLGINAGSSFALALCFAFFPDTHYTIVILCSFLGAAVALFTVYGLTGIGHRKQSPLRLVLAGSAISMFLSSISQAVSLYFQVGQAVTFWSFGGVAGIRMQQLAAAFPFILAGLAAAVIQSPKISMLSLGEDAALGLGLSVGITRSLCMIIVLVLAGCSVALAGPVAFAGLMVPHIVRSFVGADYRNIIPASIVAGAFFMLAADIVSRLVNAPSETPVGLVFAVIGVPFFIYTARKDGGQLE